MHRIPRFCTDQHIQNEMKRDDYTIQPDEMWQESIESIIGTSISDIIIKYKIKYRHWKCSFVSNLLNATRKCSWSMLCECLSGFFDWSNVHIVRNEPQWPILNHTNNKIPICLPNHTNNIGVSFRKCFSNVFWENLHVNCVILKAKNVWIL